MTDKPVLSGTASGPAPAQRLDQWLCFARVTKSRSLAQTLIERGKVRVNREKVARASQGVKPGDVVTLSLGPRVRILSVKGFGTRRGPASEAQSLYEELTLVTDRTKSSPADTSPVGLAPMSDLISAMRPAGAGRPTKRDRRATERLKDRFREC